MGIAQNYDFTIEIVRKKNHRIIWINHQRIFLRKKCSFGLFPVCVFQISVSYFSSSLDSSDDGMAARSAFSEFRRRIFLLTSVKSNVWVSDFTCSSGELGGVCTSSDSSSSLGGVFDSELPDGTRRRGEDWFGMAPFVWRGLNIPESVSVVSVITHSSNDTSKEEMTDDWHDNDPFEFRLNVTNFIFDVLRALLKSIDFGERVPRTIGVYYSTYPSRAAYVKAVLNPVRIKKVWSHLRYL